MKGGRTRRLAVISVTVAAAMLLSYVEHLLPAPVPIAGVKLGLANIATVFALYTLGAGPAVAVSLVRVFLSALLFGNALALLYSLAGAVAALAVMMLLKRCGLFSAVGVSVAGGVFHNVAQIFVAAAVMRTEALIVFYLPWLLICGVASGAVIGVASGVLVKRLEGIV